MPVGLAELLFLLLVALCVVLFFRRRWLRRNPKPTDGLATCGQCGYAVRGIATLTCPECGADLREVGIRTPKRGVLLPILLNVVLLTILIAFFGAIASVFVANYLPLPMRTVGRVELATASGASLDITVREPVQWLAGAAQFNGQGRISIGGRSTMSWSNGPPESVDLILTTSSSGQSTSLRLLDRQGGNYTPPGQSTPVHVSWPPTRAEFDQLCHTAGLRLSSGEFHHAYVICVDLVIGSPTVQLSGFHQTSYAVFRSSSWRRGIDLTLNLVIAATWIAGVIFIIRRARRLG